jgi:hypothetical protein
MRNCFQPAGFTAIRGLPFDRHEPVRLMNGAMARCSKSRHADLKRFKGSGTGWRVESASNQNEALAVSLASGSDRASFKLVLL